MRVQLPRDTVLSEFIEFYPRAGKMGDRES